MEKFAAVSRLADTYWRLQHSVPFPWMKDNCKSTTLKSLCRELDGIFGHGKIVKDSRGVECVEHRTGSYNTRYYIIGTEPTGKHLKEKF